VVSREKLRNLEDAGVSYERLREEMGRVVAEARLDRQGLEARLSGMSASHTRDLQTQTARMRARTEELIQQVRQEGIDRLHRETQQLRDRNIEAIRRVDQEGAQRLRTETQRLRDENVFIEIDAEGNVEIPPPEGTPAGRAYAFMMREMEGLRQQWRNEAMDFANRQAGVLYEQFLGEINRKREELDIAMGDNSLLQTEVRDLTALADGFNTRASLAEGVRQQMEREFASAMEERQAYVNELEIRPVSLFQEINRLNEQLAAETSARQRYEVRTNELQFFLMQNSDEARRQAEETRKALEENAQYRNDMREQMRVQERLKFDLDRLKSDQEANLEAMRQQSGALRNNIQQLMVENMRQQRDIDKHLENSRLLLRKRNRRERGEDDRADRVRRRSNPDPPYPPPPGQRQPPYPPLPLSSQRDDRYLLDRTVLGRGSGRVRRLDPEVRRNADGTQIVQFRDRRDRM